MDYELTDFGGILLKTQNGNIAINGGGTMKQMEAAYVKDGVPPVGIVLTCEHPHRAENAKYFAEKYNIPVLSDSRILAHLHWVGFAPGSVLNRAPGTVNFCGIKFNFRGLNNNSVAPLYLIVEGEGRKIGFITDGRVWLQQAIILWTCDELVFANRLNIPEAGTSVMMQRLSAGSNTDKELDDLFRVFEGKLVRI